MIANRAAVGGERGNRGNDRRCGVDNDTERQGYPARVAGHHFRRSKIVGAVGEGCGGIGPATAGIACGRSE